MREEEVDAALATWDERLRRVDENLLALEGEPTYQMLAGGARATLEGLTRERVEPALHALAELFLHREKLSALLAEVRAQRDDLGFWGKDEKLAVIERLLAGPSIVLGSTETPVARRTLLDRASSEVAVHPEQLLAEMAQAYQVARDAVADVATAWARLEPRVVEVEERVAAVRREANRVGGDPSINAELDSIRTELDGIRAKVARDPLGVSGLIDSGIRPRVEALHARFAEIVAARARVGEMLAQTGEMLAALDTAFTRASASVESAAREVAGFEVDAAARAARVAEAEGLISWRNKLVETATAAHFRAAEVGLGRWFDVARQLLAQEDELNGRAEASLAARSELVGRLSARRAHASALAARGAVIPAELDVLAREAEQLLRETPVDLRRAGRTVDQYDTAIVHVAARAKAGTAAQ